MILEAVARSRVPATDLGFLLHKHPDRVSTFATSQGVATVFYPQAAPDRVRMAFHVDGVGASVAHASEASRYVNAIAYEASTRLVVALGKVFGDALSGRCRKRPDLIDEVWELSITLPAVPVRGTTTAE